jgi:hypothetical protein
MRTARAGIVALGAAACLYGTIAQPLAYTVITRDGHRIVTTTEPEIRGIHAFMRLEPHGQLVVIQEVLIDWEKTQAVNPSDNAIVVPADTELVEVKGPEGATAPIRHTIKGSRNPSVPQGKGTATPAGENASPRAESSPADLNDPHSTDALAGLRREHLKLSSLRDEATESLRVVETELQDLRGRMVRQAGTDGSDERRAQELQLLIDGIRRRIGKYEARIDDIKAEAISHGSTID